MPRKETREPLLGLIARARTLADVIPDLHQRALGAVGGVRSLLFERDERTGALRATSAHGVDPLPSDAWNPSTSEAILIARMFTNESPTVVPSLERALPRLAALLDVDRACLVPLPQNGRGLGLLALGMPRGHAVNHQELDDVAGAFSTVLELFRLRQIDGLQKDLRVVLDEFAGMLGVTLNLSAGLDAFCHGANRLFGAERTTVWVHDRRAHHLVLRASSDAHYVSSPVSVDDDAPAAHALARHHADVYVPAAQQTSIVTVPLRGCRRALGVLVFEGVRIPPGREPDVLDRANELGRQLSSALENIHLLDDVMRSRRELENMFDSIAHPVAVWDRRGRIVHANHAFASRVGVTRDDLLDRPLSEFVGAELYEWLTAEDRAAPAADLDGPTTFEVLDPVLNGPFMVTVTALLNPDRERVGHVLVARDLTAQAKLQAEREELRRRLMQSEKLAALGQFVAGIAHELNNPLQGVLGHLELLRVTGAFPKNLRREVQTIYREADRAAKIVRNLLAFSGSRRLARRAVSVNAVLQKVVVVRAPAHRAAEIEVVRHYDEKLPRVQSDPLLLHQVFLNVIINAEHAIAATGHGGRIEIRTSTLPGGDRVKVSVRDTGNGIPPEVASRIFEPFYTTKDVGKGTGLGLAITYGIVQEHGGEIVVANHPEGGAEFTISLPLKATPRAQTQPVSAVSLN